MAVREAEKISKGEFQECQNESQNVQCLSCNFPNIEKFVNECHKFQKYIMNVEYLSKPIILNNACETIIFEIVAHSCCLWRNMDQAIGQPAINEIVNDIISYSKKLLVNEIHLNVTYMPIYFYETQKMSLIPMFKLYDKKKACFYITFNKVRQVSVDKFLDAVSTKHVLLCTPINGEYPTNVEDLKLQFFNLNSNGKNSVSRTKTYHVELVAKISDFFSSFCRSLLYKIYYGVPQLLTGLFSYLWEEDYNRMPNRIVRYCQNQKLDCNEEKSKIVSRLLLSVINSVANSGEKIEWKSHCSALLTAILKLFHGSNHINVMLAALFGMKEPKGEIMHFNGPGSLIENVFQITENFVCNSPLIKLIVIIYNIYMRRKENEKHVLPNLTLENKRAYCNEYQYSLKNFLICKGEQEILEKLPIDKLNDLMENSEFGSKRKGNGRDVTIDKVSEKMVTFSSAA